MALDFSGSGQYINTTGTDINSYPFTICAWIYPQDTGDGYVAGVNRNTGAIDAFYIGFDGVTNKFSMLFILNSIFSVTFSNNLCPDNTWSHICCTWVAFDTRRMYFNGSLDKNDLTGSGFPAGFQNSSIACRNANSDPFDGAIAEVGMWNVELTAAEILSLGTRFSPALIRPNNLVYYAPLITTSPIDYMSSRALTITGSPTQFAHPKIFYPEFNKSLEGVVIPPPSILHAPGSRNRYQSRMDCSY